MTRSFVNFLLFIIFVIYIGVMFVLFLLLNLNPFLSFFISTIFSLTLLVLLGNIRLKKRSTLIEVNCDPEAFLEATNQMSALKNKTPNLVDYFDIDRAAAFLLLGDFEKAKRYLEDIDISTLSVKSNNRLIYVINLITCYYELGDIEKAEQLFETEIPLLSPLNKSLKTSVKILIGERYYYLEKYKECEEYLSKIIKEGASRRIRLCILYRLAQIDEINGAIIDAKDKYKRVAKHGNKLWVATQSLQRLEKLDHPTI